jgi:hypothetical protein
MDNPETLSTLSTQDTGQINIRENLMGNQEIRFSLTFISPVSCVLNVDSVSGFSILDGPLGFHLRLFVLCLAYLMLTVPLDCPFLMAPSVLTEWTINNGQSIGTVNIEYTRHRINKH